MTRFRPVEYNMEKKDYKNRKMIISYIVGLKKERENTQ